MTVNERTHKLGQLQSEKLSKIGELESQLAEAQRQSALLGLQLEPYKPYLEAATEITASYASLMEMKRDFARTEDQRAAALTQHQGLSDHALLERKALTFYSSVLDDITEGYVGKLEQALNEVYLYVFCNPQKSVKLALEDRYNKKVLTLNLINIHDGEAHEESLNESGYSVSVVLGTVLLVYFLMYNNLERIVFFDESISGLAVDTSARFFALLRVFVEQQGFKFAMISHETRHTDYADKVYSVRAGKFTQEVRSE